jgi:2-succinyl-6-hydroxy-2,4-cyclohexadiene-1-carboxylate synthase
MHPLGEAVAARIGPGEPVEIAVPDAPGHGSQADRPLDLAEGADDLARRGGAGTWIGYSMGARYALHVALAHPDLVQRLVTIGGTPGLEDAAERAARRAADEELAAALERDGVEAFLERWLAQPMFAGLPPDPEGLAERHRNTAAGLAASLRLAGTGTQLPLWDQLATLQVPVLAIAGANDLKFTAIGQRMAAAVRDGSFVAIDGAGHAAHLERPDATADAIASWMRRLDAPAHPPSASPSASSAP